MDTPDLAEEVRRIFAELERSVSRIELGECMPPLDVIETDSAIEVIVDVPGVLPATVRVALKGGLLIVAGLKVQPGREVSGTFHLVERSFGRFARGVPLASAFDGAKARATIRHGELRVTLPKLAERRGRRIPIAVVAE